MEIDSRIKFAPNNVFFWDVDTQFDFMYSSGALYVKHAEKIVPILKSLTQLAKEKDIVILGSMDWHDKSNPELIRNGGEFPDHCMENTRGAEKIPETILNNIKYVENLNEHLKFKNEASQLIIRKKTINVFDKKEIMEQVMKDNAGKTVITYGVATDYCVKMESIGFLKHGFSVYVIEDAIKGIENSTIKSAREEMIQLGAKFISFNDLKQMIV